MAISLEPVEINGLESRFSDHARGIIIVRCGHVLSPCERQQLWEILAEGGITEAPSEDDADATELATAQLLAAPWMPPTSDELAAQRAAFERAGQTVGAREVWCFKVETGLDALAWQAAVAEAEELSHGELATGDADDDDDATIEFAPEETASTRAPTAPRSDTGPDADARHADAEGDPSSQFSVQTDSAGRILYEAPDAPDEAPTLWSDIDADPLDPDDYDDLDVDDDDAVLWRNGAPPMETQVRFPLERYPEVLADDDTDDFLAVAIKLAAPPLAGTEHVINAIFALWLSVYEDERSEDFEPFRHADVVHDRAHRAAVLWVDGLAVSATDPEQVHFLMWILARLHDVIPVMSARFCTVDQVSKIRAQPHSEPAFVLAGNPLGTRFKQQGEEAAFAWAATQNTWTAQELSAMLVEIALEQDPDDADAREQAEVHLRRALAWHPHAAAEGYLAIVLIKQGRFDEAYELARQCSDGDIRLVAIIETAQTADTELPRMMTLLDAATVAAASDEHLAELAAEIARAAPHALPSTLAAFPQRSELIPHLYNASFGLEPEASLQILQRVLELPPPAAEATRALRSPGQRHETPDEERPAVSANGASEDEADVRAAWVMAWNNACIHAHALGEFNTAVEIANRALPYGAENPYIFHSSACAFVAVNAVDRALESLTHAIEHGYERIEMMESDPDLAPLFGDPRFRQLFRDWRTKQTDLN